MLSLATFLWCLKHRICSRHSSGSRGRNAGLRVLRGNSESPVEPWQELLQHPVGFPDAAAACQPEFGYQPVLERSRRALHAALCLGRQGENHLNPQFLHGPAELGRHPGEAGAGRVPEDPVPVGVEGDGYAATLHQVVDQQEVAVGVSHDRRTGR